MKSYIKINSSDLPMIIAEQRNLTDEFWKEQILSYILLYYKETDNNIIQEIIQKERQKKRADIEAAIKNHIKKWFMKSNDFLYKGFLIDKEVGTDGGKVGFYDFKIRHSYWNYTKSYFPFECKNLGTTDLLNEYVFVETKDRIDGGIYRYFIDKYAVNLNFGGLIGFVIYQTDKSLIEQLIEKITVSYSIKRIGQLTDEKIIRNSIFNNSNTIDSIHLRQNAKSNKTEKIVLHHVIMDFMNTEN